MTGYSTSTALPGTEWQKRRRWAEPLFWTISSALSTCSSLQVVKRRSSYVLLFPASSQSWEEVAAVWVDLQPPANAEPVCMTVTVMDAADVLREHLWTDSESVQLSLGYSEMSVFSCTLNEYIAYITPSSAYLKCQKLLLSCWHESRVNTKMSVSQAVVKRDPAGALKHV